MKSKNDGLTVGELSIAITSLIIIGFIWTNITKEKRNQEVSIFETNAIELSQPKQT